VISGLRMKKGKKETRYVKFGCILSDPQFEKGHSGGEIKKARDSSTVEQNAESNCSIFVH
jgi:hypothetical protein